LHTHSSKIKVKRDGTLSLTDPIKEFKNLIQNRNKNSQSIHKSTSMTEVEKSAAVNASGVPYDPFNPDDDSSEDNLAAVKNEVKSEPEAVSQTTSDIKSEPKEEPKVVEVKKEPATNKLDEKKTAIELKKKIRSKSPSPHRKVKSKTRSKSRSPRRHTINVKTEPMTSKTREIRRSRSSSSSRRRHSSRTHRNGSRNRHRDNHRKSGKKSRSRSRSTKSSRSSRSSDSPSRARKSIKSSKAAASSKHGSSQRGSDEKSLKKNIGSDQRATSFEVKNKSGPPVPASTPPLPSPPPPPPSAHDKKSIATSSSSKQIHNKEQKISDYLIEEMINEEKQQTIDINKIKLPNFAADEARKVEKKPAEVLVKEANLKTQFSNGVASLKTNLDKRLDLIFGNSASNMYANDANKINSGASVKIEKTTDKETTKENGAQSKPVIKQSINQTQETKQSKHDMVKRESEEAYDPEREYRETTNTVFSNDSNNNSSILNQLNSDPKANNKKISYSSNKKVIKNLVLDNQEKIVNAAKLAMKPFYLSNKVSKEDYKVVMKKVVTKCLHQNKTGNLIDTHKINKLVAEYVSKHHQTSTTKTK